MILCIDCGNTFIKVGLFDRDLLKNKFEIKTNKDRTCDEYLIIFRDLLGDLSSLEGAIISSVVPSLTNVLKDAIKKLYKVNSLVVGKKTKIKMAIKIDNPSELGADMVVGAVAAKKKYGYPVVVADLGTATKVYVIDKDGSFIGCSITAGMESQLDALVSKTSLLHEVTIEAPEKIIGKNTKDSLQSGIVYGQAYMISEFARRIEAELGYKVERILTGGYSSIIKNEIVCFHYEENLNLEGLYYIYLINNGGDYEK